MVDLTNLEVLLDHTTHSKISDTISDSSTKDSAIKVLVEKMKLHKSEINLQLSRYHASARYSQIVTFSIIAAFSVVIKDKHILLNADTWYLWAGAAVVINFVLCYLVAGMMESLYVVILLGVRCSQIERSINSLCNMNILAWEDKIVGKFWIGPRPFRGIYNPGFVHTSNALILFFVGAIILPITILYLIFDILSVQKSNTHILYGISLLGVIIIANFLFAVFVLINVIAFIRKRIEEETNVLSR
ncbi:hypothetical protein GAY31_11510 [Azospirillum brasilense]|nr:hypothetical protein [Azospirillum brasilense]